jgi:hypothetical protein
LIPSPQASGALPIEVKEVYQQTTAENEYPAGYLAGEVIAAALLSYSVK